MPVTYQELSHTSTTIDQLVPDLASHLETYRTLPVTIRQLSNGDQVINAAAIETSLEGCALMNLLAQSKKSYIPRSTVRQSTQGRFGILDDWNLVDNKGDLEKKLLLLLHAQLGQPWQEFNSVHRKPFTEAVKRISSSEIEAGFAAISKSIFSLEYLIQNTLEFFLQIDQPMLYKALYITHALRDNQIIPKNAGHAYIVNALKKLTIEEKRQIFLPTFNDRHNLFVIDTQSSVGFRTAMTRNITDVPIHFSVSGMQGECVVVEYENSHMVLKLDTDGTHIVETKLHHDNSHAFKPQIVWQTAATSGQRKYLTHHIPTEIDESPWSSSNALTGLLFIAAISDHQRMRLPERRGISILPNGHNRIANLVKQLIARFEGVEQDMEEAQMPLVALMYKDLLLESPVFPRMESLISESN